MLEMHPEPFNVIHLRQTLLRGNAKQASCSRMSKPIQRVSVIDSHTGGEPTRVVVAGGPDLGRGPLAERREKFQREFDYFRSAVVNEPRGSDVMVGALLVEPQDKTCAAGVIFFNNVGYLGMCGHGTIGLIVTLAHLGKIKPGNHKIETPVGIVTATLHENGEVSVANIPSWRAKKNVSVNVPKVGEIFGDVAWGGNWFFLVEKHGQELSFANAEKLTNFSWHIRQAVNSQGFPEVDHVELFSSPKMPGANSKNFVLCPGKAYDRSACGTGTSAKLACLAADGKLAEGAFWIQESFIGSAFTGKFRWLDRATGKVEPTITGSAFVNAETTLLLDEHDPFCWGIK
jgi:4-hydroxyproline epimerase